MTMETDVLVVGGGPTGLITAISVKHEAPEMQVIVAEALTSRIPGSKALLIYPATMELLRRLNAHTAMDEESIHVDAVTYYSGNKRALRADYASLSSLTVFPYMAVLSQELIESLLERKAAELGIKFLRGYKASSLTESEGGLSVGFDNGDSIVAGYVVGADGARSSIRGMAGIPLYEPTLFGNPRPFNANEIRKDAISLVLADVTFKEDMATQFTMSFNKKGFNILLPSKVALTSTPHGDNHQKDDRSVFRLVFQVPQGEDSMARSNPAVDYIQQHVTKWYSFVPGAQGGLTIKDIIWKSVFWVRVAMATKMHQHYPKSKGNVLLVGDAAHIHSPAGGQGLNLGIKDAVAAGKAIAAHSRSLDRNDLKPLADFDVQRRKEDLKVIRMTMVLNWFWTTQNPFGKVLRDTILYFASFVPTTGHKVALRLSGLLRLN